MDDMAQRLSVLEANFQKAFPEGDYDGHRRYHQALIDDIAEKKKFRDDLRRAFIQKTMIASFWALLVWIGKTAYQEIITAISHARTP